MYAVLTFTLIKVTNYPRLYASHVKIITNVRFSVKLDSMLATIMSDQGFLYFVLNVSNVCQIKKSSKRLVDGQLGGLESMLEFT